MDSISYQLLPFIRTQNCYKGSNQEMIFSKFLANNHSWCAGQDHFLELRETTAARKSVPIPPFLWPLGCRWAMSRFRDAAHYSKVDAAVQMYREILGKNRSVSAVKFNEAVNLHLLENTACSLSIKDLVSRSQTSWWTLHGEDRQKRLFV
jgi:hypothetical protein